MNNTILLIDDDEVETGLMSRLLNRFGFEVIVSNNSLEGLQLVSECDPAMVILDLMMPEMSGWEVCKEIRQFSDVHILIFSAKAFSARPFSFRLELPYCLLSAWRLKILISCAAGGLVLLLGRSQRRTSGPPRADYSSGGRW